MVKRLGFLRVDLDMMDLGLISIKWEYRTWKFLKIFLNCPYVWFQSVEVNYQAFSRTVCTLYL